MSMFEPAYVVDLYKIERRSGEPAVGREGWHVDTATTPLWRRRHELVFCRDSQANIDVRPETSFRLFVGLGIGRTACESGRFGGGSIAAWRLDRAGEVYEDDKKRIPCSELGATRKDERLPRIGFVALVDHTPDAYTQANSQFLVDDIDHLQVRANGSFVVKDASGREKSRGGYSVVMLEPGQSVGFNGAGMAGLVYSDTPQDPRRFIPQM